MSSFLQKHKLPQLTQYEIGNLNSPIMIKETGFVSLKLPQKKSPGPHSLPWESHQMFNEKLTAILYKLYQKTEQEETLPHSYLPF